MTKRLPDFEAWAIFSRVARLGSFARAARDLTLSKATVSKAVARLEERLGASLFHRTSRRLALTDTGRAAADLAERILTEAEAAEARILAQATAPRGIVRLAAPMSFGLAHVVPLLPEFLARHPGIELDLHLDDAMIDLVAGGFDLALRISALPDSSLRMRRICQIRRRLVAAPAYLARRGVPRHPSDLGAHDCLDYANLPRAGRWTFVDRQGRPVDVVPSGPLRANSGDALQPAVLAGLGLAVQPEFMIWKELAAGDLVPVMEDWEPPPIMLNLVTPPGRLRPARVTVLMAFFRARLGGAPWASAEAERG